MNKKPIANPTATIRTSENTLRPVANPTPSVRRSANPNFSVTPRPAPNPTPTTKNGRKGK